MRTQNLTASAVRFFYSDWNSWTGPPVSVCGALQKLRLTEQACFMQTAAHAAPALYLPSAARRLAAIPNTEVKLMYADNTWRVTAREDR